MTSRDKIIEKIQKLLRLAEKAGTEEEAALASQRAHEFLAKHNIDIAEVAQKSDEEFKLIEEHQVVERYNEQWRRLIMAACAELYFCKYFFRKTKVDGVNSSRLQSGVKHCFLGKPHNVAVAKEMGTYLVSAVNRLANEGSRNRLGPTPTSTQRGRYVNTFRRAAAVRLVDRLYDLKERSMTQEVTTADGSKLPALLSLYQHEHEVIKQWMENAGLVVHTRKSNGMRNLSNLGARDGKKAGDEINLGPQIGRATPGTMLRG